MLSWQSYLQEFLYEMEIQKRAENTVRNYRYKIGNIADYFSSKNIEPLQLTTADVKAYVLQLIKDGKKSSTINIQMARLRVFYDYLVAEGYLQANPVTIKRLPVNQELITPLNQREIKELLQVASNNKNKLLAVRDPLLFMLLIDTGLRKAELVHLKNEDMEENHANIRNPKYYRDRAVPLSPVVKKQLAKYLRVRDSLYEGADSPTAPLLVTNYTAGGAMTIKAVTPLFLRIKPLLHLRPGVKFSAHALRHTYAQQAILNGMDIYTLSVNLGHRDVYTTAAYLRTLRSDQLLQKSVQYSPLMNLGKERK